MKIGIIGVGAVGSAVKNWFDQNTKHAISCFDPQRGFEDDLTKCQAFFLCVPAPNKNGTQDTSILEYYCKELPWAPTFIKTTVLPGTCDRLTEEYKKPVFAMPEFLTERRANEDFKKQDAITGCWNQGLLFEIFEGKKNIIAMSNKEAELSKYAHNCFGALKVTYCNAVYDLCERLGINYEQVRKGMLMTGYINPEHTQVPGPDGKFGYGGKCFPENVETVSNIDLRLLSDMMISTGAFNQHYRAKK